jgi:ABC-2 type transport system permease protein
MTTVPIYEETYHSWPGRLKDNPRTWWVIARTGVRLLKRRTLMSLLALSFLPFFIRAVQVYMVTRLAGDPRAGELMTQIQVNPSFFEEFLRGQNLFLMLMLIVTGAGFIANDRKFRALPLYFSKPVGFWDYFAGKLMAVSFYGSLITLLPALLLFLLRILLAQDTAFLREYWWIPISLTGQVLLTMIVLGSVVLALSSAAKTGRSAAVSFFGLLILPDLLRDIVSSVPTLGLFSLLADLRQVATVLFGLARPFNFSVWAALVVLVAVVGVSLSMLRIKVSPTEVVR